MTNETTPSVIADDVREPCGWPEAPCACYLEKQAKPEDIYGRVWMHCEEGLAMTKASTSRFLMFCLKNRVEIGDVYAFNPRYHGSSVVASVRLRPDQFEAFESETGGKLRKPPKINLNSRGNP